MNIVLLQAELTLQEIDLLLKEFPQYLFLSVSDSSYKHLGKEHWSRVEILFGSRLTFEELSLAHQLRWVQSPTPHLNRLCLSELDKRGNILITNTADENIPQIGEYVISGILALAKNLFSWREAGKNPQSIWDSKWRETMWTLKDRTLLQIGLSKTGTEVARRAKQMDMRVFGVGLEKSFHPYCHKVVAIKDLRSVLPIADVVSICLPRAREYDNTIHIEELELMKQDAILSIIGSSNVVNQEALIAVGKTHKLRGIILDAFYQTPISPHSELWKLPNILITPEVAPRPRSLQRQAFRTFLFNLRQYVHGNFKDMRNLVEHEMFHRK
jgi:phosphoglycerate dehydrogenase-like enzyme